MCQEEGRPSRQEEGAQQSRRTSTKRSTTHVRAHGFLRDTLIATAALAAFVGAIVVVGIIVEALPPVIATVVGVIGVGALLVLAATREEGRRS